MMERSIDYTSGDTSLRGRLVLSDSPGKRPGVLVAHDWGGRNAFAHANAERHAKLGYVALALDMYGDGKTAETMQERAALMQGVLKKRDVLMARMNAALALLKAQPEVDAQKTGATGFCFGGLCVLDLARSGADVSGVVSFHGLFNAPPKELCKPIKSKVLVLHGYQDPMAPPEHVVMLGKELTESGCDWQLHAYGNAVHAFTNPAASDPKTTCYEPVTAERAYRSMRDFFADLFG
jgi:dienelactone hydrolase